MFEVVALTYGLIASYVMASVHRNRREARSHPAILVMFGWTLMAFSMTTGICLLGYAGYGMFAGSPASELEIIA